MAEPNPSFVYAMVIIAGLLAFASIITSGIALAEENDSDVSVKVNAGFDNIELNGTDVGISSNNSRTLDFVAGRGFKITNSGNTVTFGTSGISGFTDVLIYNNGVSSVGASASASSRNFGLSAGSGMSITKYNDDNVIVLSTLDEDFRAFRVVNDGVCIGKIVASDCSTVDLVAGVGMSLTRTGTGCSVNFGVSNYLTNVIKVGVLEGLSVSGVISTGDYGSHQTLGENTATLAGSSNYIGSSALNSVIAGGVSNQIYSSDSFIAGGFDNSTTGVSSVILGGMGCSINGAETGFVAIGENSNIKDSKQAVIIGGKSHNITSSHHSVIIGGGELSGHVITSTSKESVILGGDSHSITSSLAACAIGGNNNNITANSNYSGIYSGSANSVTDEGSVVVGGKSNNASGLYSFIGGGGDNQALGMSTAIIGGGNNTIEAIGTSYSVIAGGRRNRIQGKVGFNSRESFIGGGDGCCIAYDSYYSGIIAGGDNMIGTSSSHSFIGGGGQNTISTSNINLDGFSAIIGGRYHSIDTDFTAIAGGTCLKTSGGRGTSFSYSFLCGRDNDPAHFPWDKVNDPTYYLGDSYRFSVGCGSTGGVCTGFAIDNFGNVYFGTSSGCSIYQRTTGGGYTAKSFTIDHPEDEEKFLVHGCLEGPEAGVYYRGSDTAPTTVKLPSYATKIAKKFTVQVTPIGKPRLMGVEEVSEDGTFDVYGDGRFHWTVTGERLRIDTEPYKNSTSVKRFGPYSWIEEYP